jgi:hypothetical protein
MLLRHGHASLPLTNNAQRLPPARRRQPSRQTSCDPDTAEVLEALHPRGLDNISGVCLAESMVVSNHTHHRGQPGDQGVPGPLVTSPSRVDEIAQRIAFSRGIHGRGTG